MLHFAIRYSSEVSFNETCLSVSALPQQASSPLPSNVPPYPPISRRAGAAEERPGRPPCLAQKQPSRLPLPARSAAWPRKLSKDHWRRTSRCVGRAGGDAPPLL